MTRLLKWFAHTAALIFTASTVGAFVSWALTTMVEWQHDGEDGDIAAITVAVQLEDYANACSDIAGDYEALTKPDRSTFTEKLPMLPVWRPESSWRTISRRNVGGLLDLQLSSDQARSYILSAVRFAAPADVAEATHDEAVLMGAQAWRLAERFRRGAGFAPLQTPYPFGGYLMQRKAEVAKKWREVGGPTILPD